MHFTPTSSSWINQVERWFPHRPNDPPWHPEDHRRDHRVAPTIYSTNLRRKTLATAVAAPPESAAGTSPTSTARTPAEQPAHPAVAQHIQILDAVRAGRHPGHDRRRLATPVGPGRQVRTYPPGHQACQVDLLGQPHHRHQPGTLHQIRIIEDRVHGAAAMQQSHLRVVLSTRVMVVSATPIFPSQRAPSSFRRPRIPKLSSVHPGLSRLKFRGVGGRIHGCPRPEGRVAPWRRSVRRGRTRSIARWCWFVRRCAAAG
jgi:hypothetical protein